MVEITRIDGLTKKDEKSVLWKDHSSRAGRIRNSLLMQICLEPDPECEYFA